MSYTPENIDGIRTDTTALVNERFTQGSDFAENAYNVALTFINQLRYLVENIDINVEDDLDNITFDDSVVDIPAIIADKPVKNLPPESELSLPTNLFSYTEEVYASTLLTKIKNALSIEITNGSTGLSANVETAIQDRETERDALVNQEATDVISSEWAERGWGLPSGLLQASITKLQTEYQNKQLDKSRTIEERSETLAIENRKFILDKIVALETILIDLHDKQNSRTLEAAKSIMASGIALFDMVIKKFGIYLDMYKVDAQVYEGTIRAAVAMSEVEISRFNAIITKIKSQADVAIKKIEIILKKADMKIQPQLEAIKSSAAIAAQLAAGALAGISASVNLGANASVSGGVNSSFQYVTSESTSETTSVQRTGGVNSDDQKITQTNITA